MSNDVRGPNPGDPRRDVFRSLFLSHQEPAGTALLEARPRPQRAFQFFAARDNKAAAELADEFEKLFAEGGDDGLRRVMERFHAAAAANTQLAQWALRFFIGRHPGLKIPLPTVREQLVEQARTDPARHAKLLAANRPAALFGAAPAGEAALKYFRHDIDLSDHHVHWHTLYPWSSRRPGISGRLFIYMHQQMLARYDTERITAGLNFVVPYISQWDAPQNSPVFNDTAIPADPLAPWIVSLFPPNTYADFDLGGNSPNQLAPDFVQNVINDLTAMASDIKNGNYTNDDDLGSDIEASSGRWPNDPGPHNSAHCTVSFPLGDPSATIPNPNPNVNTVMIDPTVAMTTPIFFQVHRGIDDYSYQWQLAQGPDPWNYKTPDATIRRAIGGGSGADSPDLIVTPRANIPGIENFSAADLQNWAQNAFGGPNFNTPITDPTLNAPGLGTQLVPDQTTGGLHLQLADDWVYSVRLQNGTANTTVVTARLWLAAEQLAENRRLWIEMDKFTVNVGANAQVVFARPSWYSTVVRAKSLPFSMQSASQDDQHDFQGALTCECGLPYRLLLPKGKPEGMRFRFMLMLTDAAEDGLAPVPAFDETCGSVSFCGNTSFAWPDNKPMGFPFYRPFPGSPPTDNPVPFLDGLANVVWRPLTITNR